MIPYPSRVTFGEGTLSLAAQQFSGPPEIAGLLAELGMPVAGGWSLDPSDGSEAYRMRAGAEGLEVRAPSPGWPRWPRSPGRPKRHTNATSLNSTPGCAGTCRPSTR